MRIVAVSEFNQPAPLKSRNVEDVVIKSHEKIPPERPQKAHTGDVEIGPLGTLIYTRLHWEAPPCPPGYRARSSDQNDDDSWILDPIDAVCKHLQLKPADIGACGYQRIARRCKLIDSFVGARTCETCSRKE